jgi:hypothetical protein
MAGGPCRFKTGSRLGAGLGTAATFLATVCLSSPSSSDASVPKVGLGYHKLARILQGGKAGTYLDVEAVFDIFFDEEDPGVASSSAWAASTISFSDFASNAGGLPASFRGGAATGAFNPFPFLLGAKGSSLGRFWITLDLLSSSSSSGVGMVVASFGFVSSRSRFFPSILCLSFDSPGPDLTCFSGSSAPTPKLDGYQNSSSQKKSGLRLTVGGVALFLRVPSRGLSWEPRVFSWASTK